MWRTFICIKCPLATFDIWWSWGGVGKEREHFLLKIRTVRVQITSKYVFLWSTGRVLTLYALLAKLINNSLCLLVFLLSGLDFPKAELCLAVKLEMLDFPTRARIQSNSVASELPCCRKWDFHVYINTVKVSKCSIHWDAHSLDLYLPRLTLKIRRISKSVWGQGVLPHKILCFLHPGDFSIMKITK